jgi:hypothetical protein
MQILKSCHIDFGFNDTVCENLVKNFSDANDMVQEEVRAFRHFTATVQFNTSP